MTNLLAGIHFFGSSSSGSTHTGHGSALILLLLVALVLAIIVIVANWKLFQKAGKPGWAAIIPIYSSWTLAEVGGKPGWWGLGALLAVIPVVGGLLALVIQIMICLGVARNFGKSQTFGIVGLAIFSFVGFPILGFGDAKYDPDGNSGPTIADTPFPTVGGTQPPTPPAGPVSQ